MLVKLKEWPEIFDYVPQDRELLKVPRQWLIDVAFTVIGQPFADWVADMISKRNDELAEK